MSISSDEHQPTSEPLLYEQEASAVKPYTPESISTEVTEALKRYQQIPFAAQYSQPRDMDELKRQQR